MKTWIYSEDVGNGVFNIARLYEPNVCDTYKFVFIDKHGIANIFNDMENYTAYVEGNLDCERECVEVDYVSEGYDTLDQYLGMDEY